MKAGRVVALIVAQKKMRLSRIVILKRGNIVLKELPEEDINFQQKRAEEIAYDLLEKTA